MSITIPAISPVHLSDWYARNRARSRSLFDLIDPEAYYTRPISLRNPIVFYEGHLPAFSVIAFLKRGLGRPGVDARLEQLFARGIDPEDEQSAVPRSGAATRWPSRPEVIAYGEAADEAVLTAMAQTDLASASADSSPLQIEGLFTALEHEAMHQETLLYMWRRLPYHLKRRPGDIAYERGEAAPRYASVAIPAGMASLGAERSALVFGWDNEFERVTVHVPAFDIDKHSVTNADFAAFMADGGYDRSELWSDAGWEWRLRDHVRSPAFWIDRGGQWFWRGMFEEIPLPDAWPVYVSQMEADAYARWRGRRLPTEAEFHRAAFGVPGDAAAVATSGAPPTAERELPWGDEGSPPDRTRGNFDFEHWEPVPAGSRPEGASAWGVEDLVGNGWEWTSTVFAPFPGFRPMVCYPEYSAEFFDGQHYVMKGASPGTARELIRRTFRNWFRPNYPYVYAKFRTVADR